jgi:uncharacterized YigZ family protein
MKYVKKEFTYTIEEKKSKFIAYLCPYNDFNTMMERLKKEHTKARHFVYAYRYLNEFGQIVENSSDDGEPKGTSGKPSLKVLAGNEVINSGVIIVRYFGGIRLGTGGLVRAYSDTVNKVCQEADFILYEKLETKKIELSYNELSKIEYQLQELDIKITNKEFKENVILTIQATKEKLERADVKL